MKETKVRDILIYQNWKIVHSDSFNLDVYRLTEIVAGKDQPQHDPPLLAGDKYERWVFIGHAGGSLGNALSLLVTDMMTQLPGDDTEDMQEWGTRITDKVEELKLFFIDAFSEEAKLAEKYAGQRQAASILERENHTLKEKITALNKIITNMRGRRKR